jgi:hypothetical protein
MHETTISSVKNRGSEPCFIRKFVRLVSYFRQGPGNFCYGKVQLRNIKIYFFKLFLYSSTYNYITTIDTSLEMTTLSQEIATILTLSYTITNRY